MVIALASYGIVLALHIMAVILAFGAPLSYPLLLPYVRRTHPEAMPGLHAVQHRLDKYLTGPGTLLILVFGAYLASERHLWGEPWVGVPLAILVIIGGLGGYVVRLTDRLAVLSSADVEAAPSGAALEWSGEYDRVYARYMRIEVLLGLLVLIAIFFMAAKPFA